MSTTDWIYSKCDQIADAAIEGDDIMIACMKVRIATYVESLEKKIKELENK